MRSRRVMMVCLLLLVIGACRTDPAVVMLERENRQLEDTIYRQQDLLEKYRRALATHREAKPTQAEQTAPSPQLTQPTPTLVLPAPRSDLKSPEPSLPKAVAPLVVELPKAMENTDRAPNTSGLPKPSVPKPDTDDDNTQVTRLVLRDTLAWDYEGNSASGHQGINLLVQPCDATGRTIKAAAPISVVVLDPAFRGEAARVARWNFSAEQVARLLRGPSRDDGIYLEMVWPDALPVHERLHLFVRYTTDDGRKVEADQLIDVNLPEDRTPNVPVPDSSVPAAEKEADRTAANSLLLKLPSTPADSRPEATSKPVAQTASSGSFRPKSVSDVSGPVFPRTGRRPSTWSPNRP